MLARVSCRCRSFPRITTVEVVYAPGRFTYTKDKVGTRYVFLLVRTLANPEDQADLKAANAIQDAIKIEQANIGKLRHFLCSQAASTPPPRLAPR